MARLLPSKTILSDRFPVCSFVVQIPPERFFEIACATDPALFHADYAGKRSPANFYTSREDGLLRAPNGEVTYLLPAEQLERFAGAERIYYALGTYGNPDGTGATFSLSPESLDSVPSIRLARGFTGRSRRFGSPRPRKGGPTYGRARRRTLRWGGDDALEEVRRHERAGTIEYDDGFDPGLWSREPARPVLGAAMMTTPAAEPPGYEDIPALRAAMGATSTTTPTTLTEHGSRTALAQSSMGTPSTYAPPYPSTGVPSGTKLPTSTAWPTGTPLPTSTPGSTGTPLPTSTHGLPGTSATWPIPGTTSTTAGPTSHPPMTTLNPPPIPLYDDRSDAGSIELDGEEYGGRYGSALLARPQMAIAPLPAPPQHVGPISTPPAMATPTPAAPSVTTAEPPGFEDVPALRAAGAAGGASGAGSIAPSTMAPALAAHTTMAPATEPPGFEDAPAMRAASRATTPLATSTSTSPVTTQGYGLRDASGYGAAAFGSDVTTAATTPLATSAAPTSAAPTTSAALPSTMAPTTVAPASSPISPMPTTLAPPATAALSPLTVQDKFDRIVLPVAQLETGMPPSAITDAQQRLQGYGSLGVSPDGRGLEFGLLRFQQARGDLGQLLTACRRRDNAQFQAIFGASGEELLRVTNAETPEARLAPVAGHPLWSEAWGPAFVAASQVPEFQFAQNEIAIERFIDPNLLMARRLGFDTDRSLAMLCERCVDTDLASGREWIVTRAAPMQLEAIHAQALPALGRASVQDLQAASGIPADGQWNAETHAALVEALRALGPASPIPIPPLDQMLDRLVAAAEREPGVPADRVRSLRTNRTALHDTIFRIE